VSLDTFGISFALDFHVFPHRLQVWFYPVALLMTVLMMVAVKAMYQSSISPQLNWQAIKRLSK